MGFLSDFVTDIFGGESDRGPKMQREENALMREFVEQQTQKGVDAVNRLYPQADKRLKRGISSAANTLRLTPQAQAVPLIQGNQMAQQAILGGMGAYERAILGLPTGTQNMSPMQWDTQGMFTPFAYDPQRDVTRVGQVNATQANPHQANPLAGYRQYLANLNGVRLP